MLKLFDFAALDGSQGFRCLSRSLLVLAIAGTASLSAASAKDKDKDTKKDAPPTIAVAASASEGVTYAKSVSLSVLGSDDQGESNLIYTWSASGPRNVSFSSNKKNVSKNTVATFRAAGLYTLSVTVTDKAKQTVTSQVNVYVDQNLSNLVLFPKSFVINPNKNRRLRVLALDQFRRRITDPSLTWTTTAGTVSDQNIFKAGSEPMVTDITVASSTLQSSAKVRVNEPPTLDQDVTFAFQKGGGIDVTVLGADDGGEANLTYQWALPAPLVLDGGNKTNAAKNSHITGAVAGGTYTLKVHIRDAQNQKLTVNKTITYPATWPAPHPIAAQAVSSWDPDVNHGMHLVPEKSVRYELNVAEAGEYYVWMNSNFPSTAAVSANGVVIGSAPAHLGKWSCRNSSDAVLSFSASMGINTIEIRGDASGILGMALVHKTASADLVRPPLMVGPGSIAVIDGDDFDSVSGVDGHAWYANDDGSITAQPDFGDYLESPASGGHSMDYALDFQKAGTYTIWINANGTDNSDSLHLGLNGTLTHSAVSWFLPNQGHWSSTTMGGWKTHLTVPSAGVHHLNLWWREDGVQINQIAVAGILSWEPAASNSLAPTVRQPGLIQGPDGSVVILPKNGEQIIPSFHGVNWSLTSGGLFSPQPDTGIFYDSSQWGLGHSAMSAAWVYFDTMGTYDVWMRGSGPDWSGKSIHVGNNGSATASDMVFQSVGPSLTMTWSRRRSNGGNATITVDAPGWRQVNVWCREDGTVLDRLLIQPIGSPAPTGVPSESERAPSAPSAAG